MSKGGPKITFLIEFPESRALMGTWCDTLDEAKALKERFPGEYSIIYAHVPLELLDLKALGL